MSQYKDLSKTEKRSSCRRSCRSIKAGRFSSINKTAQYHGVPESTLKHRPAGRPTAWKPHPKHPNQQLVTDAQKAALKEWCEDLFSWGFPVRYGLTKGNG